MNLKKLLLICLVLFSFASCSIEQIEEFKKCEPRENIWKDAIIPYKFTDNTPQHHKDLIYEAIAHYEENTPVRFVEYFTDDFYSLPHGVLMKYTGYSSINSSYYPYGQGDYITDLRMGGDRWFDLSTAIHELGHVVGLPHEHQRADRDEYIIIHWDNIPEAWHGNYDIEEIDFISPFAVSSIMNYDPTAVAIDKTKPTVEVLDGSQIIRTTYLTELDIEKINELYCYELNFKEEETEPLE